MRISGKTAGTQRCQQTQLLSPTWTDAGKITVFTRTENRKKVVFRQPRITYFHLPPTVGDIEQVNCFKLLGAIFQSNFKMELHVHYIISESAQRMYLLKLLRHQGMSGEQLSVDTHCIIISRVLYTLPAWGGFLSAELANKINAFFRRLKRFGYTTSNITVSDLIDTSSRDLFHKLCSSEHSLHHLLPPEKV